MRRGKELLSLSLNAYSSVETFRKNRYSFKMARTMLEML